MDAKPITFKTVGGFTTAATKAPETTKEVLASAPTVAEVLARPFVYEAWLIRAQEALKWANVGALNG